MAPLFHFQCLAALVGIAHASDNICDTDTCGDATSLLQMKDRNSLHHSGASMSVASSSVPVNVLIDSSGSNTKCVTASQPVYCNLDAGHLGNRINSHAAGDMFAITTTGTEVCARRTDYSGGWGMHLEIACESVGASGIPTNVLIDSSGSNSKCVTASAPVLCDIAAGDLGNRINSHRAGDTFLITAAGSQVCARRTDYSGGWGMHLEITCEFINPNDARIDALEDQTQGLHEHVAHNGGRIDDLGDNLQRLGEAATGAHDEQEERIGALGDNVQRLSDAARGGHNEQEERIDALGDHVHRVADDAQRLHHEQNSRIDNLGDDMERFGERAQGQHNAQEERIGALGDNVQRLSDAASGAHDEQGERIEGLEERIEALVEHVETLEGTVTSLFVGLQNGNLDDFVITDERGYQYENMEIEGWEMSGRPVMISTGNAPWGSTDGVSGSNFLGLQRNTAAIKQTVGGHIVGRTYNLVVHVARRVRSREDDLIHRLRVTANAIEIANLVITNTVFESHVFSYTADSANIEIELSNAGDDGDQTVFLDALEISMVGLQNGDFEDFVITDDRGYQYENMEIEGWQVSGRPVMISTGNAPWGSTDGVSGRNFLGLQRNAAAIKQTVGGHTVGLTYNLEVHVARRVRSREDDLTHRLRVTANGIEIANLVITNTVFESHVFSYTADSANTEIELSNTGDDGDQTVFLDALKISTSD